MKITFLLLPLLLIGSSCVYFNIFYNAEKHFEKARKMQDARLSTSPDSAPKVIESEKAIFNKSIEKCSKVLDQYPQNKEYVAKATLLLGEIYYWEAEYSSSIRKFNEFTSHYPEHPDYFRAIYYKGLCYFEQRDFGRAEPELENVADNSKSGDLKTRARYLLSEISVLRGSSFGAIDELKKLEGGGKMLESLIHYQMGLLLFKQKDFKEAYKHFILVEPVKKTQVFSEIKVPENLKYQAELMAGSCLKSGNEPKKALAYFEKMLDNDLFFKFFGVIYGKIAACYADDGNSDEAKRIYLKIIKEYPKTKQSAAAYYYLGLMYENVWNNIREAFECFKKSQVEFSSADEAILAKERYVSLRALTFLTANLDSMLAKDTAFTRQDSSAIDSVKKMLPDDKLFKAAEIYLYRLGNGDSAVMNYRKILVLDTASDSTGRLGKSKMKGLYAIAWINGNILAKKDESDSLFRVIIKKYPATDYAKAAQKALGGPDSIRTHADSVIIDFLAAESLYSDPLKCKNAIASFQQFVDKWPKDILAQKAMFAIAWLNENCLYDNAAAETAYRAIHKAYPETDYGRFARMKLEGKKENLKDVFVEKPGQGPEGTVLDEKVAKKMESIKSETAPENSSEEAWVTLKSLSSTSGRMEGKRSEAVIRGELKPAIEAIDETYIDLADEGLKQEGDLTVRFTIKSSGEIAKVKTEKQPEGINDKTLVEEVENMIMGMEFDDGAKEDVAVEIHIAFKKKKILKSDDL